jgi:PAS domain S-box-containing protein
MLELIKRVWMSFALALAILLGVAAVSYQSSNAAEAALARVKHTGEVLEQIVRMNADYVRAATARRTYIVAGDRSQLGDVARLDAQVRRALSVIRELVSDNPSQQLRLDALARTIDERFVDLDASVERRHRTGAGGDGPGEIPLTTRVQTIRDSLVLEEHRLRSERNARTREQLTRARLTAVVGVAFSVAILVMVFVRMRREIERRRRSEGSLAEKEAFLHAIVETIPDMVTVKDAANLHYEQINPAGEKLLGRKREDLLGKLARDVLPREWAETAEARDRSVLAAGVPLEAADDVIQTKSGEAWLHTRRVPIVDEAGVPRHLLQISEDITESRKMLEALKQANFAAEAANHELREARAVADSANQAKSEFLSSMSHEVRTPLNAILGFAQLLQRDKKEPLSSRHRERVDRILASGEHLLRLIDDILDLSRIEARAVSLSIEPVSLVETLAELKTNLEPMATRYGVRLEVALIPAEAPRVLADRTRLTQILLNFGSNAIKYNRPSGTATFVMSTPKAGQVRITVRDDGLGIPETKQGQLFQPFQRAGQETGPIEGTGIGLVVTKRLAEMMHGGVGFRSVAGEGSEFWVDLPVSG